MFFFNGRSSHSLDEKSRLMLPKKIHGKLEGSLYMTLGIGGCIYLYTAEEFEKLASDFLSYNDLIKEERSFRRLFFANATDCALDKQGRLLLPKDLMQRAGITKDVIVTGNINRIEIWDRERYEQTFREDWNNYENLADTIGKRSLEGK